MIIPDVNVLVYAYNRDAKQHPAAKTWWEQLLTIPQPVGLPWATILGFIRISTQRRILERPLFPQEAILHVRRWLEVPGVRIVEPGEKHADIVFQLIEEAGTAGDLTSDAHLAAIAIEHGGQIASTDADFSRFRGLRWFNPLEV
jgi:hypothetical protein